MHNVTCSQSPIHLERPSSLKHDWLNVKKPEDLPNGAVLLTWPFVVVGIERARSANLPWIHSQKNKNKKKLPVKTLTCWQKVGVKFFLLFRRRSTPDVETTGVASKYTFSALLLSHWPKQSLCIITDHRGHSRFSILTPTLRGLWFLFFFYP